MLPIALALSLCCHACGLVGYDNVSMSTDASVALDAVVDADTDADADAPIDADEPIDATSTPKSGFARACAFTTIAAIQNGQVLNGTKWDDQAALDMAASIALGCGTTPGVRELSQDATGVLDPTTNAPLLGASDLMVVGGGNYYNRLVRYLEMTSASVFTPADSARYRIRLRVSGVDVVNVATSAITDAHDFAAIQIQQDAGSSTTIITTFGSRFRGTLAGAYYFVHQIAPALPSEMRAYVVIEWTNADGVANPSAGDTFTVLASGF